MRLHHTSTDACHSCSVCDTDAKKNTEAGTRSVHDAGKLNKLGVNMKSWDYVAVLAGNPNVGKSTVFNALTGLHQRTGNWPGKTVTRAEGGLSNGGKRYKIVDLPGTYSLLSSSAEEELARDFILFGKPDVTVVVVDATCLERNLNLVLQILEISDRVLVCLNLMDEAKRHRLDVNHRLLAKELGVPVVPTSARYRKGIPMLVHAIDDVATGKTICRPHRIEGGSEQLKMAIDRLVKELHFQFPGLTNARWVAMRLLEADPRIIEAVKSGELGRLRNSTQKCASLKEAAA